MVMRKTIVDAIRALGDAELVFGSENPQRGESEFQLALGKELEELTGADRWSWRYGGSNEEKFKTDTLANERTIKVDVVGRHPENGMVAIELKYVPASVRRGGTPSNPPAFPYDVAKDCLRLDLLRAGRCEAVGEPIPDNLETYAIGLTDWPDYWQDSKTKGGWAANFYKAIRSKPVPHFVGTIHTLGSNSNNTIALGRCHIAFGRRWTGEWIPYGSTTQTEKFRYLLMSPEMVSKPQWKHHHDDADLQSATFPFLNGQSRDGWVERNSSKRRRQNE